MTHANAFSLDRAISDALLPYTVAPNPVNLPESAHPTLFAVEPEDPQVTIRRLTDENTRLQRENDTLKSKLFILYNHATDAENVVAKILGECRA